MTEKEWVDSVEIKRRKSFIYGEMTRQEVIDLPKKSRRVEALLRLGNSCVHCGRKRVLFIEE